MAQLQYESYPRVIFKKQGRMVAGLVDFPSEQYYDGRLEDGPGTALADREITQRVFQFMTTEMDQASLLPSVFIHVIS